MNEKYKIIKTVSTAQNNEIQLIKLNTKVFKKPLNILIIGVVHGDEPQGEILINEYLKSKELTAKNNIYFIPCLNPDGLKAKKRTNSNGVDINRNFPAKNWELTDENEFYGGSAPASEKETKFLIDTIADIKPEIILTLHAPYKVVNFDGPAESIAQDISKIIGYPVEASIGYPTPGSFGTYAGIERNISVITLELDEMCPIEELISPVHKIFNYLCNV